MEKLRINAEVGFGGIGFGMVFLDCRVDGAQLGAGIVESGAGGEAAEEFGHAMDAPGDHGGGKMMRAGHHVGDDFRILGIRDGGFEHADDCAGAFANAAKTKRFPDDRRIFLKGGRPETVRENNDAGGVGAVVLRFNETTEDGMKAHHVEIRAVDYSGLNFARLAEADHCETGGGELAERAEGLNAGAQIVDLGNGKRGVFVADAKRALPDVDQPVLVTIDEGLEEDAADECEDGGVGADAERQGKDHNDRKPAGAQERVKRNSQIAEK